MQYDQIVMVTLRIVYYRHMRIIMNTEYLPAKLAIDDSKMGIPVMRFTGLMLPITLLLIACTTPSKPEAQVTIAPTPENVIADWYSVNLNRLGTYRPNDNTLNQLADHYTVEQTIFFVIASFDTTLAVNFYHGHEFDEFSDNNFYTLEVSVRDDANFSHQDYGEYVRNRIVVDRYSTDLTRAEFRQIKKELHQSGFYDKAFSTKIESEVYCLDGTTYFIEGRYMSEKNIISRHTCDPGFSEDISFASPLIELARKHMPVLDEKLAKLEAGILSSEL